MLRNYGELIGLIFQIKDDLFDFEKTSIVGKPVAFDIKRSENDTTFNLYFKSL